MSVNGRPPVPAHEADEQARQAYRRGLLDAAAALRAELPTFSCYEPARLIGTPCSCVVGMARAIEIVEGVK